MDLGVLCTFMKVCMTFERCYFLVAFNLFFIIFLGRFDPIWSYVGTIFGGDFEPFLGRSGVILGRLGIMLVSFWHHFGVVLVPF